MGWSELAVQMAADYQAGTKSIGQPISARSPEQIEACCIDLRIEEHFLGSGSPVLIVS